MSGDDDLDSAESADDDGLTEEFEDYDLGGEEGGERELASDDPFFISKKAAAVFKHKLISVYFPKIAGKAASTESDKRLAYVDTHARRGRYDDGTAGSPLLIAGNVAGMFEQRQIDCFFVEKHRSNYNRLCSVLSESMPEGAVWKTRCGAASAHIAEAIQFAGNSPLFMFVDPYGLGPTFPEVASVLNRPRVGVGGRKTELLLNFITSAFSRAGGYLKFDSPTSQQLATLDHLDAVLDGDWWRAIYQAGDSPGEAVGEIAEEYARRVSKATNASWTLIPVFNRAHHSVPVYWLLHFTYHADGLWWIREAAAQASAEWRKHLNPPPAPEENVLFSVPDPFPAEEAARQAAWIDEIELNARVLLDANRRIDVRADAGPLFGKSFGRAWAKHLRAALARLYTEGILTPKPLARDLEKYIGLRVVAQPDVTPVDLTRGQ